jgi:hypothetical protein
MAFRLLFPQQGSKPMTTRFLIFGAMFQAISFANVHGAVVDMDQPEVFVRMFSTDEVPTRTMMDARVTASRILQAAGVRIRWADQKSAAQSDPTETIDVRFLYSPRVGHTSKALAEAAPFAASGIRITVFFDRVLRVFDSHYAPDGFILGHVLAHEIGHVLLKMENHSQTGLMKARWTQNDFQQMRWKKLDFTPDAVVVIQQNLKVDRALAAELR